VNWFASPLVWALAALVPYAILQVRFLVRLGKVPEALGSAGSSSDGSSSAWRHYVVRRAVASVAGGIFWVACALASAGALRLPRYVSEPVLGAELAFVVDASNSMLVDDGGGQRLQLARDFAARLAATADGASLSVVAFRGRPATLCPPTRDRRAFAEALRWAGPTLTSSAGSDVGAAIDDALRPVLRTGTARVIVVFSDGNDTGGQARAAASRAVLAGATLAFVGFGGQKAIPVSDADGQPVSGQDGQPILTGLDESAMRDWATAGRGLFVRADDPGAFAHVASLCSGAAKSLGKRRDVRVDVDATPALTFIAMAALGLALALSASPHSRTVGPDVKLLRRRKGKTNG
jgi:hypothetical protein